MRLPFNGRAKITSPFGERIHPISKSKKFHYGIDLVIEDKKVVACESGTVVWSNYSKSAGNWVVIRHTIDLYSVYMHLESPSHLKQGQTVREGDFVGIQGNTGASAGSHLHFQFRNIKWGDSMGNDKKLNCADILGIENKVGEVQVKHKEIEIKDKGEKPMEQPKVMQETMKMNVLGKEISVSGINISGSFYCPLRSLFEQLGLEVEWTPEITNIKLK